VFTRPIRPVPPLEPASGIALAPLGQDLEGNTPISFDAGIGCTEVAHFFLRFAGQRVNPDIVWQSDMSLTRTGHVFSSTTTNPNEKRRHRDSAAKGQFKIQERYGPDKKPNEPSFTLAEKGAMVNRAVGGRSCPEIGFDHGLSVDHTDR
jgi:hypothetical protein